MLRPGLRGLFAAALVGAAALTGCGGGGAASFPGGGTPRAGGSGELNYALPSVPVSLDPLLATSAADQTVTLQVFEPLSEQQRAPYGRPARPGLVLSFAHSGDRRVWSVRLRSGVRFEDGRPLNAAVVALNAVRWRNSDAGRTLLPGLLSTDAPRPDLARFVFAEPVRDLRALLASPRLGIVSPAALKATAGGSRDLSRAGSGPFVPQRRSEVGIVLVRNRSWWGTDHGLGPALDQIGFGAVPSAARRLSLLRKGDIRVAAQIAPAAVRHDPLLATTGSGPDRFGRGAGPAPPEAGTAVAYERSVRGIRTPRPEPLAPVWLTTLAGP